jgi:hypothetical protein
LNNKGQFSIIAALLVAIVLIATVIMTYSSVRYRPIQEQPQVLSAIDETNLALKQILGFTVGYYGSVLQVTGNSSYARTLAMNYLQSGLSYISNMHPEWGASFTVNETETELSAYWFTRKSYSLGNIRVNYSLTGLGIYGVQYETFCRLSVEVKGTTLSNQTVLRITKDNDEPLINLGKQNFKFYLYRYTNSTWATVNPSSEPTAFANGTYLIDIPPGINPYSYAIQVEDPRGIIVVASSFSSYTYTFTWNSTIKYTAAKYAILGSVANITGAPDKKYARIEPDSSCNVMDYEGGTGTIKQVYFNITYYSSTENIAWYYSLDGGAWTKISDLKKGGDASSPLKATYDATSLRAVWTWDNLNTTDIQFRNSHKNKDAYVDAIYVTVVVENVIDYSTIQNETLVVELLQNGTVRWLGQNLQFKTEAKPILPIPIKAIRVNQTIDGVNREVPFQIEDWASDYTVPLGLTSNASTFSNRNMLVFLVNSRVSKVTIWWNGSDTAKQTPYAYTNLYFTGDNPSAGRLTNGILTLQFGGSFTVTSTVGSTSCTANFMRINNKLSTYGSGQAYTIHHGIVRDIVHTEAEWSSGIPNCPNVYSHLVLTLPANTTYYTYQLRLMFVNSQQDRTITELCPIKITASSGQPQTENGTVSGFPIVSSATDLFYNYSASIWAHHWSQFTSGTKGAGIMFTDEANKMLYAFDSNTSKTGALKVNGTANTIELLPVSNRASVSFKYAFDVIWHGAVVTFDGTTPIYMEDAGSKSGLWITVEYPPTITVNAEG